MPCPHCGETQWLQFERLRWEKGKPETAHYMCEACDAEIAEAAKTDPAAGVRGISAFIVDADTAGLDDNTHLHVMSPHPLATL